MSNWNVGSKGTQSQRVTGTAPKKTPRSYETHPGISTFGGGLTPRVRKGTRKEGMGAKNRNLRLKTPQR